MEGITILNSYEAYTTAFGWSWWALLPIFIFGSFFIFCICLIVIDYDGSGFGVAAVCLALGVIFTLCECMDAKKNSLYRV